MNNLRTKRKIELDGFVFVREGGHYRRGSTTDDNPERWLHRYVWHKHKGPIPAGYVVHHKDEDKSNNDISNLELMRFEDHSAHHGKKTDNSHLSEKVWLRLETLEQIDKPEIKVLEFQPAMGLYGMLFVHKPIKQLRFYALMKNPIKKEFT